MYSNVTYNHYFDLVRGSLECLDCKREGRVARGTLTTRKTGEPLSSDRRFRRPLHSFREEGNEGVSGGVPSHQPSSCSAVERRGATLGSPRCLGRDEEFTVTETAPFGLLSSVGPSHGPREVEGGVTEILPIGERVHFTTCRTVPARPRSVKPGVT